MPPPRPTGSCGSAFPDPEWTLIVTGDDQVAWWIGSALRQSGLGGALSNAASAPQAAAAIDRRPDASPRLAIIDMALPGGTAAQVIGWLALPDQATTVLALGSPADDRTALDAIRAGAHGYLSSEESAPAFVEAVSVALRGGAPLALPVARGLVQRLRSPSLRTLAPGVEREPLTAKETEVLQWLALGHRDKEIALRLGVSTHTIASHVKRIYQKLGVHSRPQLRRLLI